MNEASLSGGASSLTLSIPACRKSIQSMSLSDQFSDSFWGEGDKGFDVLLEKLHHSKLSNLAITNYISTRVAIEEEYGRKMMKLAKTSIYKDDYRTFRASLDEISQETENIGKNHLKLANDMKVLLEKPILELVSTNREIKKQQKASVEKSLKQKQSQTVHVLKMKFKYFSKCKEKDLIAEKPSNGSTKDLDKLEKLAKKAKESVDLAEEEYKASIQKLKGYTEEWKQSMIHSCNEIQNMEENRIKFAQSLFIQMSDLCGAVATSDVQSYQEMRQSFDSCDMKADIKSFLENHGTGKEIPEPCPFINYYTDSPMGPITSPNWIPQDNYSPCHTKSQITIENHSSGFNREREPSINMSNLPPEQQPNTRRSSSLIASSKSSYNNVHIYPATQLVSPSVSQLPNFQFEVRALYTYKAQAPEELAFSKGQIIRVTSLEENPWWIGYIPDRPTVIGIFPSNFVQKLS